MLLLTEKKLRSYSEFQKGFSGYYIAFINYILALIFTKKNCSFNF